MRALQIETFTNGKREDTVKVPVSLAKVALSPLLAKLNSNQADLIVSALNSNDISGVILEIEEHQENEKVVFSII
ncbi:hypothetical protein [Vibrio hangzhouensis]|uniref:Uncharacterized protein n=1 Tax=Vibrio hangzhouensis TaxID=462991 RepID=A0A1H5W4X8_9VIBR|nr:hypothetical protein [Vibrio hangzhouensis]SEF94211.1 hypothetical protein SAMN04488244_105125 [Vibrio hangzhouensis]